MDWLLAPLPVWLGSWFHKHGSDEIIIGHGLDPVLMVGVLIL